MILQKISEGGGKERGKGDEDDGEEDLKKYLNINKKGKSFNKARRR